MSTFNLADLFEASVDAYGDREYLVAAGQRRTYAEMEERANRLAHFLAAQGVGPGDHVGIYALNSVEWVETAWAVFKLRAVWININYRYVEEELRYLFANADLVALVHQAEYTPHVTALRPELPDLQLVIGIDDGSGVPARRRHRPLRGGHGRGFARAGLRPPVGRRLLHPLHRGHDRDAQGRGLAPRGRLLRPRAAGSTRPPTPGCRRPRRWWRRVGVASSPSCPSPRSCTAPPSGASWARASWATAPSWCPKFDPHEVWRLVESEKANSVMITGDAMGKPLIEALDEPGADYDLSSLLAVTSSAALFSAPVKDEFFRHFPNLVIVDAIGSSESGNNGMATLTKGQTAMKSGPTVSVLGDTVVFDEDLRPVVPGSGVVGKIARSGDIPVGYYNDPEKTAEVFITVDGTRFTMPGDFATIEADGTITLLGRGSVSINSGGEKIFPEEVESAVRSHPAVLDAIVVGAPDDRWGQRVAAIIQPRGEQVPTLDEIQDHCRSHIAGYKVPRQLHVVELIERSPSGKPDYRWAATIVAEAPEESDAGGARTASGS